MSGTKRGADVPRAARVLGEYVSKADLLEAAYWLAALASPGGLDDEKAAVERLLEELNTIRDNQGRRRVSINAHLRKALDATPEAEHASEAPARST